jgi:hypothetical protein
VRPFTWTALQFTMATLGNSRMTESVTSTGQGSVSARAIVTVAIRLERITDTLASFMIETQACAMPDPG